MKKAFYILLAASAALFISCAKEVNDINTEEPVKTGKTITFTASVDMPYETRATLSDLNIHWQSGEYIGIATDNNATIVAYPITPDGVDPTKCTITVNAVDGASAYYAVYKGDIADGSHPENNVAADDFSGITFDAGTKTFSGLTVGKQQVAVGSLSSKNLYYTNGYPLAMAGKSSGTSITLKPCLALFKLQINSASVPADYYRKTITYRSTYDIDHPHEYSAVRGFNLYQKGASTIYSSGDYTVAIADNGDLTVTSIPDSESRRSEYRQISQSAKLVADTDYIMCMIPGGSTTSFLVDFLGYSNNEGGLLWDAAYTMRLSGNKTVAPGDCYDLGKLNPLGRKQAKNEADDEAADAAAASYVPAITIDGDLSDWATIPASFSDSGHSRIREWRFKSDAQKVYFYIAFRKNRACTASSAGLYIGFDKDNDNSTGNSYGNVTGCEAYARAFPFTNASEGSEPVGLNAVDANSEVWASGLNYHNGTVCVWHYDAGESVSSSSSNTYVELSIPREYLNLPSAGNSIMVGCSFAWYETEKVSVTLE